MEKAIKRRVSAHDIAKRHPRNLVCPTDLQYAMIANELFEMLQDEMMFMEEEQLRNACITLALYMEDDISSTRQFETFTNIYQRMYGHYVPFYEAKDATDANAQQNAMEFMFWYSCTAERDGSCLNPMNEGIRANARKVLDFWNERKATTKPNDALADYLFCEETQSSHVDIKNVLIWIQNSSMLGRWFRCPGIEEDEHAVKELLKGEPKDKQTYVINSIAAFRCQAWPLSLKASHIYAEMIRLDMDDPKDELAEKIEGMDGTEFGIWKIAWLDNKHIAVIDFKGDTYKVSRDGMPANLSKYMKKDTYLMGSLMSYDGEWYTNGFADMVDLESQWYEQYRDTNTTLYSYMHDFVGQYDEFIKSHNGERLYFFKNEKEYRQFVKRELGVRDITNIVGTIDGNTPFMVFLEPNGQITLSPSIRSITHPDNIYFDDDDAKENGLFYIGDPAAFSPDAMMYLIEKDYLNTLALNDVAGYERGKHTLQNNMEFLVRCMRRDIVSRIVYRRRDNETPFAVDDGMIDSFYTGKMPFQGFVNLLSAEKVVLSKARKEWKMVKCNSKETVIRDVAKRKNFTMSTEDLYEAYNNLKESEIQVSNLVPYVGRENAPAASAILYSTVGSGRTFNYLRKKINELFNGH